VCLKFPAPAVGVVVADVRIDRGPRAARNRVRPAPETGRTVGRVHRGRHGRGVFLRVRGQQQPRGENAPDTRGHGADHPGRARGTESGGDRGRGEGVRGQRAGVGRGVARGRGGRGRGQSPGVRGGVGQEHGRTVVQRDPVVGQPGGAPGQRLRARLRHVQVPQGVRAAVQPVL